MSTTQIETGTALGTTRREMVRFALTMLVGAPLLAACRAVDSSCTDLSALSPAERDLRATTFAYQEKSPNPAERCAGCVQYGAATADNDVPGGCGRCQIVRGPVNPNGRCKRFVASGKIG